MTVACDLAERYLILRALGRGPHAQVYVARNRTTRRLAAIKILERGYVQHLKRTGRLREARALAASHLPGVVACETVACDADDGAFVASELLEGMSLAVRLGRGPLPCADAVLFCLQVGLALGEARDQGVLHGGLKPSNVFVVSDPELPRHERALLADFGTATPRSDGDPLVPSTDVRDLGNLLHQLLTGAAYAGESVAQLIERGIAAVLAILIARTAREVSIEATVDALEHAAATCEVDADPTDSNLPLRAPPRVAASSATSPRAAALENTTMFRRIEPDELDRPIEDSRLHTGG